MLEEEQTYKYKAFISYSHKDEKFGAWLHKSLEKYKIPKELRKTYPHLAKKLHRIFRDREELSASSDLPREILEGLYHSEYLIVICSINSAKSKWVNQEIIDFKKKHGEDKVLAIILDGEPHANSSDKFDDDLECFPEALKFKVIDGVLSKERAEPLAPDVREGKDEREVGKLKLIAGIIKVNFDDLWEREKRDKFKQRRIKGVFLLLFVVLIGFGYFKYKENNDLRKYGFDYINTVKIVTEERALLLTNISDEQKYKINENIEKLEKKLLDIKEATKAISKIDGAFSEEALLILRTKGAKVALDFINSKESIFAEEQMLIQLADKHRVRANIYIANQKYDEAIISYEKVMKYYDSFDNTLEYALFLMKQNDIRKSIKLHEKLNKEKISKEQEGGLLNNLGLLYERVHKYIDAENMYLKALKVRKTLVKSRGSKEHSAVSITLNNLATLYTKLNRLDDAEKNYLKALEIRKKPYIEELSNNSEKSIILSRLAVVYMKKGKYKDAEKKYLEALEIEKNFGSNIAIAVTLTNLGLLYKRMKLFKYSEDAYLQAIKIERILVRKNKMAYNLGLAATLNNLGSLYSNKSTLMVEAENNYFEALEIYRGFEKINPNIYIHRIGGVLSNLTRLYIRNKKVEKGRETYAESVEIYRILVKKNRNAYGMTLASILIVGVSSLNQSSNNLDIAKNILQDFKKIHSGKKLLRQIKRLKEKI